MQVPTDPAPHFPRNRITTFNMAKESKRAVEVIIDEKAQPVVESVTKEAYQALLNAYAAKNPAKFEQKKAALLAKLASL